LRCPRKRGNSSVGKTQTALGAFYRRLAVRIGKPKAITATARKLAILVYRTLKGELAYSDPGPEAYDARQRALAIRKLRATPQASAWPSSTPRPASVLTG
jgi:hypothetical protein